MGGKLGASDCFLFFAVFYSSANVLSEYDQYSTCSSPVGLWLIVSYISVMLFRVSYYIGLFYTEEGDENYLMHRQQGVPLWMNCCILGLLYPFFISWTIVGTLWYTDVSTLSPQCLPEDTPSWYIVSWLAICYIWIAVYMIFLCMAIAFELRARRIETDMAHLQSDDMLARWGNIQYASGLGIHIVKKGLTPAQIANLPTYLLQQPLTTGPCSICLDDLKTGDSVRVLSHCGHLFHHSCIDIWLLRNAICPLCKSGIPISKINRSINNCNGTPPLLLQSYKAISGYNNTPQGRPNGHNNDNVISSHALGQDIPDTPDTRSGLDEHDQCDWDIEYGYDQNHHTSLRDEIINIHGDNVDHIPNPQTSTL